MGLIISCNISTYNIYYVLTLQNRKLSTDVDKDHVDFSFRRFYDHLWHMLGVVTTGRGREHSDDANGHQQDPLKSSTSRAASVDWLRPLRDHVHMVRGRWPGKLYSGKHFRRFEVEDGNENIVNWKVYANVDRTHSKFNQDRLRSHIQKPANARNFW